ncbi:MAG: GAP family protein [Solirubrobacteraceae bacterium]
MSSIVGELALVALAAMFSPTTLSVSVLALVLSDRPLRTGLLFYVGALGATLAIGLVAAFVVGDVAHSSHPDSPKTWVAVVDVVAGVGILAFTLRAVRRPRDPKRTADTIAQMGRVAESPAIAIVGAGAALGNAGGFIPLALKEISELGPSSAEYILIWCIFALASLLPLSIAIVMLAVDRTPTEHVLDRARGWLERHARTIAAVLLVLVAAALLRNGIAGLSANA